MIKPVVFKNLHLVLAKLLGGCGAEPSTWQTCFLLYDENCERRKLFEKAVRLDRLKKMTKPSGWDSDELADHGVRQDLAVLGRKGKYGPDLGCPLWCCHYRHLTTSSLLPNRPSND
jgi:hypothetical protein